MSKNSWERAVGAIIDTSEWSDTPPGYSNSENELSEMRLKQRQIQQEGWDKELADAKIRADAQTADEQDFDESATWAEAYKDTNNTIVEEEQVVELTPLELIIQELERTGHFHKTHGALGSIKLLINELNLTRHQLESIKRALGK